MLGLGASFLPKGGPAGPGAAVGTAVPALSPAPQGLQACPSARQAGPEQPLGPMLRAESPAEVLVPGAIGSVPCSVPAVPPRRG